MSNTELENRPISDFVTVTMAKDYYGFSSSSSIDHLIKRGVLRTYLFKSYSGNRCRLVLREDMHEYGEIRKKNLKTLQG